MDIYDTIQQEYHRLKSSQTLHTTSKQPRFEDIQDLYFTEIYEPKKKEHGDIEPYYEPKPNDEDSEVIDEIKDLIKKVSTNNDMTEEEKIELMKMYPNLDDSGDEIEPPKEPHTNGDNSLNKVTKTKSEETKLEEFKLAADDGVPIKRFTIDENHFGRTSGDPDISNATLEERKVEDEVETEEFDEALANKGKTVAKKYERLSHIVQDLTIDDLEMIRFLGDGSYGKVNLVKCKLNKSEYALKILDKKRVAKYDKINNVMREKDIMFELEHPNIARLEMTFQDPQSLFFLMEYASNGDLAGLIKREKKLTPDVIRFYACEIINALEHMRDHKVVHRDLKPENILLDASYHIKITDFGDSKQIDPQKVNNKLLRESFIPEKPKIDSTNLDLEFESNFDTISDGTPTQRDDRSESFVGTPLYVSPEMLNHNLA